MTVREIQCHLEEMYGLGALQPELCELEAAQGSRVRLARCLRCRHCRRRRTAAGRIREKVGSGLPVHCVILGAQLATHHPILRLPAGDQEGDLHHQRH